MSVGGRNNIEVTDQWKLQLCVICSNLIVSLGNTERHYASRKVSFVCFLLCSGGVENICCVTALV
jgi:RNase P subunit RPR2